MVFNYPKDIKKLLEQSWKRKGIVLPEVTDLLPEDDILTELVEVAYHASFMREEQRKIAFRIAFCSKDDLNKTNDTFYEIRHLEFSRPRAYNVHELLRLAPATDYRKVLMGVTVAGSLSNQSQTSRLKIWGLIDTGLGYWKFIRREGNKGFPSLRYLTISSDAPGNLTISLQGEVLVILRRGELYAPPLRSLQEGPLSQFFEEAQNDIYKDFLDSIENNDIRSIPLYTDPKIDYINYIERIIFHIRDSLHGGTIIILSQDLSFDDLIKDNTIAIKYRCNYDFVWDLIVKKSNLEYKNSNIFQSMLGTGRDLLNDEYWESKAIEMDRRKNEVYLQDSVLFITSLASVDGALIISDRLNLLGFGVELRVSEQFLDHIKFAEDAFCNNFHVKTSESFGTRHRSAFRFCNQYPKSVAFVISQDGDVKAVKKVNSDLIVWPDPNIGIIGTP